MSNVTRLRFNREKNSHIVKAKKIHSQIIRKNTWQYSSPKDFYGIHGSTVLPHTCITGRASLARRSTPEAEKPVPPCQNTTHQVVPHVPVWISVQFGDQYAHTLCSGMMSLSDSLSPVTGSVMSFLINFSTHSWVTTQPLDLGQIVSENTSHVNWTSEERETRWHSRGSQNGAGDAVAQDVFGDCTYIPVLEAEDNITPHWNPWHHGCWSLGTDETDLASEQGHTLQAWVQWGKVHWDEFVHLNGSSWHRT